MKRGTTPTNRFAVERDLTGTKVFVTYAQDGNIVFEKTGDDVEVTETEIKCRLSQADTLALKEGFVEIQISYVTSTGEVDRTDIMRTTADRILKDEELVFEEE